MDKDIKIEDAVKVKFIPPNGKFRKMVVKEYAQAVGYLIPVNRSFTGLMLKTEEHGIEYSNLYLGHLEWWNKVIAWIKANKKYKFIEIDPYWFYKAYSPDREHDHKRYNQITTKHER